MLTILELLTQTFARPLQDDDSEVVTIAIVEKGEVRFMN